MSRPTVTLDELSPDVRRQVLEASGRKRAPASRTFTAEDERRHALRVCALIYDLTQDQRRRVLARAQKINAV